MPIYCEYSENELEIVEPPAHPEYVKKLEDIGKKLGFSTKSKKTELGLLDCVWRLKDIHLPKIEEDLPIVAFEVICSEDQKSLKGTIANLVASRPSLAIFVLIKKEIKKHPRANTDQEKWLERIERFVEKLRENYRGMLRTEVWDEDDVDKLYSMYREAPS